MALDTEPIIEPPDRRVGIAPFLEGIQRYQEGNAESGMLSNIDSPGTPFGSIGEVSLLLSQSDPEDQYVNDALAFTVGLDGNVVIGKAIELSKKGYFGTGITTNFYDRSPEESGTKLKFNLWIDKTLPVFTSGLQTIEFGKSGEKPWGTAERWFYKGREGILMFRDDEELLKAIRIAAERAD